MQEDWQLRYIKLNDCKLSDLMKQQRTFLDEKRNYGEERISLTSCDRTIVQGLGFGLFSSPNINAVMSSVEKRFYGVSSGTLGTARQSLTGISDPPITLFILNNLEIIGD